MCGLWYRRVVPVGRTCGPGRLSFRPLHGATCEDDGVVVHVRGGECFSGQVCNPVPEIVMTHRDEAASLAIKGMIDLDFGVASVTVNGGGLGALGHIVGRGHLVIPAHPDLSRSPWTAALSDRPQYLPPVIFDVRLGLVPPLWSPPGSPPPTGRSASKPPSALIGGRSSGPPPGTPPGP